MSLSSTVLAKLSEWRKSPLLFVTEALQVVPSDQQAEALVLFPKTRRMTIRSGHGTGKDAFAAWLTIWFLVTRPYAKVICTAPTARQLNDILWSEISKWLRKSVVSDEFVVQSDKIFHKEAPKEWWARAVSTSAKASPEEQAEKIAGFHGEHLLIICDEASGIVDPIMVTLEGAMTQEDNHMLLIGNPTKSTGYFYDSHNHVELSKLWTKLHWDSRKSTNVSPEMVSYFRTKYGEESNIFKIRVAGEFPLDSSNTLIPLAWAIACIDDDIVENKEDDIYLGVDVARYGEDSSIILPRRGPIILPWNKIQGMDTVDVAGAAFQSFIDHEARAIAVDEIGVGAGVVDNLRRFPGANGKIFGINVARKSTDNMKWAKLRDQLWMAVRDRFMRKQYNLPCRTQQERDMSNELANEVASVLYGFDNNGAIKIESKKDSKSRGIPSPNIGDALCLSEYFYLFSMDKAIERAAKKRLDAQADAARVAGKPTVKGKHSWMVV